jgi:Protein of unknown function DUF262/Protein of unknown function (DUF1524)
MPLELCTEVKGLGDVLSSFRLTVPIHQRGFAWTKDEVAQLWEDLARGLREEPGGYFVGPIVLGESDIAGGRLSVIDGQQRLATVSLLFAAMVKVLAELGEHERGSQLVSRYLLETDADTLEHEPKLVMGEDDDQFFRVLIQSVATGVALPQPAERRPSQALILDAYESLLKWVREEMGSHHADWSNLVADWRKFLHDSVEAIVVSVGSDQNAYLIFETLNDRGLRLTTSDLLKNYLFATAQDRLESVRNSWSEMSTILEGLESDDLTPTFLRHYWISTKEMVRERALYRTIRGGIRTARAASELAEQLSRSADSYAGLLNPAHPRWNSIGSGLKNNLAILQVFRVTTQRPLLLAALDCLDSNGFARVVDSVTRWSVRLALVGGLGSGAVEDAYGESARRIRSGEIGNVDQLRATLAQILPADDAFLAAFSTKTMKNRRQARVLLAGLEAVARADAGRTGELTANLDEGEVNLEHVMPLTPRPGTWTQVTDEERRAHVDRLGNQALMLVLENKAAGSADFEEKRPYYGRSELLLTADIASEETWGPEQIRSRQARMAERAVRVWAL